MIYRILRIFYVSFWFYFMPFSIIICSYMVPFIVSEGIGLDTLGPDL